MNFVTSSPGQDPVKVEGYFAASPERVYNAWTDPDVIVKWFGTHPNTLVSAEVDLSVGGAWRFVSEAGPEKTVSLEGHYREIDPPARLVFSWAHVVAHESGERQSTPESLVEIDFEPKGSGTMVRLVHSAISTESARLGVGGGWEASFGAMSKLLDPASA
jgi:uncharacterized protein YndB with AHSA1/START domain